MSLYNLTRDFLLYYPYCKYLQNSFDYIGEIGNAVAHAQQIPGFQAQVTFDIGSKLIATLKDLAQQEGISVNDRSKLKLD